MDLKEYYKSKTILVTGGVGSIGSQLVEEMLQYEPKGIRVLDNNETGLYDIEQKLKSNKIRLLIGDIRDKERLEVAMEGVDIVFHAAALKHVPLCEFNPSDAIKTNVIGTQNVLDAAYNQNVQKVICISTDKAVNPLNVMGATKLLAEKLTITASNYRGGKGTKCACVRFGNVLNSRGSVIPHFMKQIEKGGPITVTHPDMKRFFMDIPTAVRLIFEAGMLSEGGEIFILKMPVAKIMDLARAMTNEFASRFGFNPKDIDIEYIGLRNGEKINEELIVCDETNVVMENEKMYIIWQRRPPYSDDAIIKTPSGFKTSLVKSLTSDDVHCLPEQEITKILRKLTI